MSLINILFANILFNNFLINYLFRSNEKAGYTALFQLQNDFEGIGLPISFTLNSWLITIVISFLATMYLNFFVYKDIDLDSITNILFSTVKIFFGYSGVLFFSLYILRTYMLSRGLLILAIFIYSIFFTILILIIKSGQLSKLNNKKLYRYFSIFISIVLISFFINSLLNTDEENISVEINDDPVYETTNRALFQDECHQWIGSENFSLCIKGVEIEIIGNYAESINNIIFFEDNLYILDAFGKVYLNEPNNIFLDIGDKVQDRVADGYNSETGLIGLAFHPTENYFLISYGDTENTLNFEKYELDSENFPVLESVETLMKVPSTAQYHFGGNIIWSNYFEDFLISVGDMEMNNIPLLNSEPLDTTSPRGKILFLDKEIGNPKLLSTTDMHNYRKDILAFGLRNPWKTYEYKNLLFVPDIGNHSEEELNIIDLNDFENNNNEPYLFGWPYFEGSIDNEVTFNEIFLWENSNPKTINEFVYSNSIPPKVYYEHIGPTYYRAAFIGGEVNGDESSEYFEHYFFADYLSQELFAYDYKENLVYQFPLETFDSYITSVILDPYNKNSVLITSGNGNLVRISLPSK